MLLGTASDPRGISLFYLVRLPNWEHPGDGVDTLGPAPVTMASSGATLTPRCQTFPQATSLEDSEYGCMALCGLQQAHVS